MILLFTVFKFKHLLNFGQLFFSNCLLICFDLFIELKVFINHNLYFFLHSSLYNMLDPKIIILNIPYYLHFRLDLITILFKCFIVI
jgi:hypothetical protein